MGRIRLAAFWAAMLLATAAVSAQPVTITYISHTSAGLEDPGNRIYQQIFQEFMEAHPNIVVEMYFGGREQVQVRMASGQAPDATFLENWYLPAWKHNGLILPLDDFVARDNYSLDEFFPFLVELSRTTNSRTGQVNLFALPRHPSPLAVFFNKEMYASAGMQTPDQLDLAEWTFERFHSDARRLTMDRNGDGSLDHWGVRAQDLQTVPHTLFPVIRAFGGGVIDSERYTSTLASPESIKAIEWVADLVWGIQVAPRPGESGSFQNGNVAMLLNIFGQTRSVIAQGDFDWDLAYLPAGPAGRFNRSVAGTHVMLSSTRHPEETWLLLKWLATDRAQAMIASGGTALPSRISTAVSVFENPGEALEGKNLRVFLDPLNAVGHSEPGLILWEEMRQTVNSALSPVWRGELSAYEGATEGSRLLNELLEEERALRGH